MASSARQDVFLMSSPPLASASQFRISRVQGRLASSIMLTLYFLDNCFYIHIQLDDHVLEPARRRLANCGEEATIRQTAFCVMAKPREYTHASPLSPLSDSSIYFVERSQINPAID